jgi:glycosyltransferase involved in cell wall biosynthesis
VRPAAGPAAFVVPAAIRGAGDTPSGGNTYNTEVVNAWPGGALPVETLPVAGSWPWPSEEDRRRFAQVLAGRGVALVDGLIGSCCPREIEDAVAAGTHVVLLVHLPLPAETDLSPQQAQVLADAERAAVAAASAVIATSGWAARDVERRYPGAGPVGVALPGTRPAALAAGSEPPQFLVLASLTPRKNHAVVVAALEALADRDWRCQFAGPIPADPAVSADLRAALRASPVTDRITVTGALTDAALATVWAATDLVLLPSLIETFGLVVTEAFAHGIPVIVAGGSGAVEALCGGDPALLPEGERPGAVADPGDPHAWARLVGRWLDEDDLRRRWREQALVRRERGRAWSVTAQELASALMIWPDGS